MRETFFCYQCFLHKPIEAKANREGKKPTCNSCNEKAQSYIDDAKRRHINQKSLGKRYANGHVPKFAKD